MDLELNFAGLSVFDFHRCYDFYTGVLGLDGETNVGANWALLGQSWHMHNMADCPGMMIEMFKTDVQPPASRTWGSGQNIRPAMQVENLASSMSILRKRGVEFTSDICSLPWGGSAEFTTPEGIRWSLSHLHGMACAGDSSHPRIGLVEMKVNDIKAQQEFYVEVMGLDLKREYDGRTLLEHRKNRVLLSLEEGGKQFEYNRKHEKSPMLTRPVWISFRTKDVQAIARDLKQSGIPVLRDVEFHPNWGGTDIVVSDPDGNPLTIAQYAPYSLASKKYSSVLSGRIRDEYSK